MNLILVKERRSLRHAFIATIALTILTALVCNGSDAAGIVITVFTIGVLLMAASSFGNEFHTRTMMFLLTQPISRELIWRDKMRELGRQLAVSFAVLVLALFVIVSGQGKLHDFPLIMLGLALIPLCVFCSTPYLTLSTKSIFAAIAASAALPWFFMMVGMCIDWISSYFLHRPKLFLEEFGDNHPALFWTGAGIAAITYCAFFYRLGYETFMTFQVIDSQVQEIRLPAPVERAIAPWTDKIVPGFTGHFTSLLRKELQLHRVSFILVGLTLIIVPVAWVPWRMHTSELMDTIMATFMITPLAICAIGIPFLTGIVVVAEERNLGVAAWQMTLPVSVPRQWAIKLSVAFFMCVTLGIIFPATLVFVGQLLSGHGLSYEGPTEPDVLTVYALAYMAWFSLLVYASTISFNSIRAMIAGLGLLAGIVAVGFILNYLTGISLDGWASSVVIVLLAVLLNLLSYLNFRAVETSSRRLCWQISSIMLLTAISIPIARLFFGAYFSSAF